MAVKIDALVVEGGGMRGVFAAGVLDAMFELGFDPFTMYFGVSAGACNLASHLAGQYKRNFRCYTDYMLRPEFINALKYLKGGHFMDLDWFWDYVDMYDTLDRKTATNLGKKKFIVVATDVETGEALYIDAKEQILDDLLKGSSSVPLMYRTFVKVEGRRVTDGGVADSIPVNEAYRRGARKIMVIRSRQSDYIKSSFFESRIIPAMFRSYPALQKALSLREEKYMEAVDFIKNPPSGCEIIEIAPETIKTGRTTRSREKIENDYWQGHVKGYRVISELKKNDCYK
ncbi:MAG TPA: patatin family protein [Spirochaetota bacterium]|nr:patatin family protein [Spirochaetota bacterium]HPJ33208.1 patatin family protein [Spirochaetota bacterium]